jgi:hypothetical protein
MATSGNNVFMAWTNNDTGHWNAMLLGGGLEVFGLDVGHLPLESGCDPSGRVCVVVTEGALIMFTGCSVPVLLLGFVAFPAGLIMPGATLIMEPKIVIAAVPYEIAE